MWSKFQTTKEKLNFFVFFSSIPTCSLFGQTIKYSKDMTASSVSSCFIAKTSQGYTHCAYFSKYSDLALIYHHKQAEYSCDRFVIFPPSRFHTSSAAPIADSLWELETRFFFFPPLSPSLWLWVSSAKWIFHLTLQKWWLGMERRGAGVSSLHSR